MSSDNNLIVGFQSQRFRLNINKLCFKIGYRMCISINLTEKLLNMLIFTIATMCLLIISDLKTMIESSANKSDIINKFVSLLSRKSG